MLLAVVDGLGHGPEAAAASRLAARVLISDASLEPAELMQRCHQALRGSRGAAMLIVSLLFAPSRFSWAGVGNVEGFRVRRTSGVGNGREALISAGGVVGYLLPTQRRRDASLEPGDLFVLASDGISPGFMEALTSTGEADDIAQAILAAHARPTDDALVLVARYDGGDT
jgi:negative regulator of sigma-B (phosphoserine phosphatase)